MCVCVCENDVWLMEAVKSLVLAAHGSLKMMMMVVGDKYDVVMVMMMMTTIRWR